MIDVIANIVFIILVILFFWKGLPAIIYLSRKAWLKAAEDAKKNSSEK